MARATIPTTAELHALRRRDFGSFIERCFYQLNPNARAAGTNCSRPGSHGKNNRSGSSSRLPDGYRLATSVGGVITGRGADFLIIDDPLKPDEAESEALRKAANEWVRQHTL